MRLKFFISILLFGVTLAIFWPARHFEMIYYDDPYILLTPEVAQGLNWNGLEWVMTAVVNGNWHPITTFSFLLVHQWFGLRPGVEHLVNVFFHAANAVLLFLMLARITSIQGNSLTSLLPLPSPLPSDGSGEGTAIERRPLFNQEKIWQSAIVAAIFAWHPLRVESLAWISERKDVLFMFFMLISLWFYANYARARAEEVAAAAGKRRPGFTLWNVNYILALVFFILSFMCKAMVVTLPFLLLLLDFWPLKRIPKTSGGIRELVLEKIPFFALTIYFAAVTYQAQSQDAAVASLGEFKLAGRIENVALSYAGYLGNFFWPAKLALLYPYPTGFDHVRVVLTMLLLLAITCFCLSQYLRRPYLAVGWFWYLGTMVPVIGLVQIGEAAMADRYTYLPLIGPLISLVWLVSEWAGTRSSRRLLVCSATAGILAACIVLSRRQVLFWQNTVTLFTRTAAVTPDNGAVEFLLAQGLEYEGRLRPAAVHYRLAIEMKPDVAHFLANWNYAEVLCQLGCYPEADQHLEAALQIDPDSVMALNNLAWLLATCPETRVRNGTRAVELGEHLCRLTQYQQTLYVGTLAAAYAEAGRFDDAVNTAQQAIGLAQEHGEATLLEKNEQFLQLYLAHKAYHEPKLVAAPN